MRRSASTKFHSLGVILCFLMLGTAAEGAFVLHRRPSFQRSGLGHPTATATTTTTTTTTRVPSFATENPLIRDVGKWALFSTEEAVAATTTSSEESEEEPSQPSPSSPPPVEITPKDVVMIFGRLAEKYIMLDDTAGMCCYSGCSDCEYRLPGGGYRMADQSSSRPKWIPSYTSRSANGRDHETRWGREIFPDGPAVTRGDFVRRIASMPYAPPLGGPYVAASAASSVEDNDAVMRAIGDLFDVLAEGKENLTKHKMSVRLKQLAGGEEGLTFKGLQEALGA